jgi:hypothetical protein
VTSIWITVLLSAVFITIFTIYFLVTSLRCSVVSSTCMAVINMT